KQLSAPLAGELSGHMFFSEGFYGHDDALYAAARLLRIVADSGRSVREMLADAPRFVSTPETRVVVPDDFKFDIVDQAVRNFGLLHYVVTVDGVRFYYGEGWGLTDASNTKPVLVLRGVARTPERPAEIRGGMESWLEAKGISV